MQSKPAGCSPLWSVYRGDLVTELTDVRRFHHDWEKSASVALRAGSSDAIDDYQAHERIASGNREEMLDALHGAGRATSRPVRSA